MQVLKDMGMTLAASKVEKCMNKLFNNTPYILKDYPVRNLMLDGIKICDFKLKECNMGISICNFFSVTKTIETVKNGGEHYLKFSLFNYVSTTPTKLTVGASTIHPELHDRAFIENQFDYIIFLDHH